MWSDFHGGEVSNHLAELGLLRRVIEIHVNSWSNFVRLDVELQQPA
jgi:hypothetical protein